MPSLLLGNPLASGGLQIISGNPWSGRYPGPYAGIRFTLDINASGNAYLAISGAGIHPGSGGQTFSSGGFALSGGGAMDGTQIRPGQSVFVPKALINPLFQNPASGSYSIGVLVDPAGSGQARFYWEPDLMIY